MPQYLINITSSNPNTDTITKGLLRVLHYEFPDFTVQMVDADALTYDPKHRGNIVRGREVVDVHTRFSQELADDNIEKG